MPNKSLTISNQLLNANFQYANDGTPDVTHVHTQELFETLNNLRLEAPVSALNFLFTSTGVVPPSMPAALNLSLSTTDGRVWNQDMQYVENDDRLSMTSSGITGFWLEKEFAAIDKTRRQLIHQYDMHHLISATVTWPTT